MNAKVRLTADGGSMSNNAIAYDQMMARLKPRSPKAETKQAIYDAYEDDLTIFMRETAPDERWRFSLQLSPIFLACLMTIAVTAYTMV